MKKLLLIAFCSVAMACQSVSTDQKQAEGADSSSAKFAETSFDFGTIKQGDKVTHEFSFTNTGESPIIISSASATCGCTVPEYPAEPIKPGEQGVIKVVFNSAGKFGKQDKVVTIVSNAKPEMDQLHLVGEVTEPGK